MIRDLAGYLLIVVAISSVNSSKAQEPEVPWWSIDGGGEMVASAGDRSLSATLGQWDSSAALALEGGPWSLTGGFWAVELETDVIFRDGYEGLITAGPGGTASTGENP